MGKSVGRSFGKGLSVVNRVGRSVDRVERFMGRECGDECGEEWVEYLASGFGLSSFSSRSSRRLLRDLVVLAGRSAFWWHEAEDAGLTFHVQRLGSS